MILTNIQLKSMTRTQAFNNRSTWVDKQETQPMYVCKGCTWDEEAGTFAGSAPGRGAFFAWFFLGVPGRALDIVQELR